eukprot:767749-Hanusia_phi.AAC.1
MSKNLVCDLCTFEGVNRRLKRGKEKQRGDTSEMLQRRTLDDLYLMDQVRFQHPISPLENPFAHRGARKGCQTFSSLADATRFLLQSDDPKNMVMNKEEFVL